jgi:hypothetical protein
MIIVAVLEPGFGVNLAAGHLQFHPQNRCMAAAILSGWRGTFVTLSG